MRSVADFRGWAQRQWPRRFPSWLGGDDTELSWPLHPPSEAEALASTDAVSAWAQAWQREQRDGVTIAWVERSWRSLGRQRLPARVTATPAAAARIAGQCDAWEKAVAVRELVRRSWPDVDFSDALPRIARRAAALGEADAMDVVTVLAWLATHPESGLWERELPVEGVDSKWFEHHRALVDPLLEAVTGRASSLRRHGLGFRVRILDPSLGDGPRAFTVDLTEMAALAIRPRRVLVCENLTTVSALPIIGSTVAVHGMGFAAPTLAAVPWIRDAEVRYWGDLDTYGISILGQVRSRLSHVESVLMDVETLEAHRALAVTEARPFRGEIGHLSLAERQALRRVREQDVRLEQERIPRAWAWPRLQALAM